VDNDFDTDNLDDDEVNMIQDDGTEEGPFGPVTKANK